MSDSGSDTRQSLLTPGRNKRQVMQEHGIETWSHKHTACMMCAVLMTGVCLGLSFLRHHFNEEDDEELREVITTPFPPEDKSGWDTRFEIMGCYPLQNGDDIANPHLRDGICMTKNLMGVPCRSGLPFYRLSFVDETGFSPVSWRFCAAYCLFKGFDISGVVLSVECRCGATETNVGVWHRPNISATRLELLWQPPWNEVPSNSSRCAILATRYAGPLPIQGINFDRTIQDVAYVRSIVRGKQVEASQDLQHGVEAQATKTVRIGAPTAAQALPPQAAGVQQAWLKSSSLAARVNKSGAISLQAGSPSPTQGTNDLEPCYPGRCSGGYAWPIHTDFKGSGIPFFFSDTVPEDTRKVFHEVIEVLTASTCIRFTEVSPWYNKTYKVRVRGDKSECFTNFMGYPAAQTRQDSEVNLGWCRTELEKGDILHELCHVLGMGHEQTRPDRDEYVLIRWDTLKTETERFQFEKDSHAYMGSSQAGPVGYDYESIMHYPLTPNMMTKPIVNGQGAHDSQIGQRQMLSPGDIFQLRNMYRCDTQEIPCIDDNEGVNKFGPFELEDGSSVTCEMLAEQGMCMQRPYDQDVRYFCAKSCGACPERQETIKVVGCQDQPGLESVCQLYKDFCPGKVAGHEDYMYQRCRHTCFIEEFCGTSTTVRDTTTTPLTTAPPNIKKVRVRLTFNIVGDGFDLENSDDRKLLQYRLQEHAENAFKTDAEVKVDPFTGTKAVSDVELSCGCDPALRLPCSIDCEALKLQVAKLTNKGAENLNEAFEERGFSVMHVTAAIIVGSSRLQGALQSGWGGMSVGLLGGMGLAASCVMCIYYYWLHSEHEEEDDGSPREASYAELSEMES